MSFSKGYQLGTLKISDNVQTKWVSDYRPYHHGSHDQRRVAITFTVLHNESRATEQNGKPLKYLTHRSVSSSHMLSLRGYEN